MNFPIIRLVTLISFLCVTEGAISSTIEFGSYKYSDNSQTVKGGSLDWMRWDLTSGLSAEEALNTFYIQGWRLATNSEVSRLFRDFGLGVFDENVATSELKIKNASTFSSVYISSQMFYSMFGHTYQTDPTPFPADIDSDGNVLHASYKEGVTFSTALLEGNTYAEVGLEWGVRNYGYNDITFSPEMSRTSLGHYHDGYGNLAGVALVRSNLLEPNPALLLCLSLAGLHLIRSHRRDAEFK